MDDDPGVRGAMAEYLVRAGYSVDVAGDGAEGLLRIEQAPFDLVVSDMKMPNLSGIDLLKAVRSRGCGIPFVLLTAYGSVDAAVSSMKNGAHDFLLKPFSPDRLEQVIRGCLNRPAAETGARETAGPPLPPLVARSRAMQEILALAKRIGGTRATVLITGESGTGKEVLARYIHACGNDPRAPFIAVNCAAIPEGLLESELFGHEKGAFTGAGSRRIGKFEQADGGTLLLDEIGEMDLKLQAKLLRVLQERTFERVGGTAPIRTRIRVIATTNSNLREGVLRGTFREDLFFRLNVFPITLPPLRDRTEDILPLAEHFAARFAAEHGKPTPELTDEARRVLSALPLPGNVRELMNRVERAVLMNVDGPLTPSLFLTEEDGTPGTNPPEPAGDSVRDMERSLILRTLERTGGNRKEAATRLGISVRTLRNKLNEYRRFGEAIP
ncbi:MAG: sigma-54 dependent transcriptional regulator [Deltaproteobacteria bacterium]